MELCNNCGNPLPLIGFFCGKCLTQFKCKTCDSFLEKDYAGCVNCGTPREEKIGSTKSDTLHHVNTFKMHETPTDRTIEATFSDNVGKDLTGMLRDAYIMKMGGSETIDNYKRLAGNEFNSAGRIAQPPVKEEIQEAEILNTSTPSETQQNKSSSNLPPDEYPHLKAIAMKKLPSSEVEWLVVYAFYASKFGKDTFTKQDILVKYDESNRLDNAKKKSLSLNITRAVNAGYINPLATNFSLLDKGAVKAKEIIIRTTSSPTRSNKVGSRSSTDKKKSDATGDKNNSSKKGVSKSGKGLKRVNDLNFEPAGKDSLLTFFKKFDVTSNSERYLIFVYYLQEILKIDEITYNHIYTCYDALDLTVSESLEQTVRNTISRTGWIQSVGKNNIKVTIKGSNQIKSWIKKS